MASIQDIPFSNLKRKSRIIDAQTITYDVIIIGGGITGVGIALDSSIRGLKTLLIEKQDFASGTSSKSTKLIHGGLRYLKQFEIGLVRETGLERAVAHRNIPHLVHPETMLLPIVEHGEFSRFTASIAINIYDYLANVEKKDRKRTWNKNRVLQEEPLLNDSLLKSGIAYSEFRTDDARLTMEIIKSARRSGAEAFNYMEVKDFLYENGKVSGVQCLDQTNNEQIQFSSKFVVSAAGPWVDNLRTIDQSRNGKSLHLTKGVHIVVDRAKLPLKNSVYFDAFDGRMVFAIPRGKVTYIGTSDTNYNKSLDRVLCTSQDVEYLLTKVNTMFTKAALEESDVISSWAGLRPLIHENGKSPSELSRKDEIFVSDTNLISIAGGKLTGFRKMSKKIVDLLHKKEPSFGQVKCKTKNYKIHVDSFENYDEYQIYQESLYQEFKTKGIQKYDSWYLTSTFGKNARYIIIEALRKEKALEEALIQAEIEYVIQYEGALKPDDYFNRRSGRLYFDIYSLRKHFDLIMASFTSQFNWNSDTLVSEQERCLQLIKDVTEFQA